MASALLICRNSTLSNRHLLYAVLALLYSALLKFSLTPKVLLHLGVALLEQQAIALHLRAIAQILYHRLGIWLSWGKALEAAALSLIQ